MAGAVTSVRRRLIDVSKSTLGLRAPAHGAYDMNPLAFQGQRHTQRVRLVADGGFAAAKFPRDPRYRGATGESAKLLLVGRRPEDSLSRLLSSRHSMAVLR